MLKIPTTAGIYRELIAKHVPGDMGVFSSFSNPDGMAFGGGGAHGEMWTQWGWREGVFPCLEAQSTWDIEYEVKLGEFVACRTNEVHLYWILVPTQGDIDEAQD